MPKQTFFNLPNEKRSLITDVVIDEFAENDYDSVSISRIVQRAGIAKGSFYQYFDGKEDLYAYVIHLITKKKEAAFSLDYPDPNHIGLFNYLRWILENGVEFELRHPRLSKIGYRMLKGDINANPMFRQAVEHSRAYYESLVRLGKAQGDIAADIDDEMAAAYFQTVMTEIGPRIVRSAIETHQLDGSGDRPIFDLPEVREKYGQMFRILEFGLSGAPQRSGEDHVEGATVPPSADTKGASD